MYQLHPINMECGIFMLDLLTTLWEKQWQYVVSNKITLCSTNQVSFEPFQVKKIEVSYQVYKFESSFVQNH